MAQEVRFKGDVFSNVPSVMLPDSNGTLHAFDDTSDANAVASDILSGKTAYVDGVKLVGTGQGGSSAWTKVAEKTYTISTTSTSSTAVETWVTGHPEIWTSEKILCVRTRDTAGKRAGYFYGCDTFFCIPPGTATSNSTGVRFTIRYTSSGQYGIASANNSTGYGVFADTVYNDGRIRIRSRFNSTYSLTIDGTFKVEVYLLDPAGGVPIFEE